MGKEKKLRKKRRNKGDKMTEQKQQKSLKEMIYGEIETQDKKNKIKGIGNKRRTEIIRIDYKN